MMKLMWMMVGALALALGTTSDKIMEPQTGRVFDAQVQGATPGVALTCTGVACRTKTVFSVKVYSIAHWVDADAARKALTEWQGKRAPELAADQRFYDALCSAGLEKRMMLIFERDLRAPQIRDAFRDGLAPSYPKGLSPTAEQFLSLFSTDVKKGQSIEFRSLPDRVIEARQDGAALGRVADPDLATAVWSIYFREKSIDDAMKTVKRDLISRIESIW